MKLTIITPEKTFYQGEVNKISVPGDLGPFEILTNHAPIISSLKRGYIHLFSEQKEKKVKIESGFIEVQKNDITICAEMSDE